MRAPDDRRLAGDRGQVGGFEVVPLGVLAVVGSALLAAGAWAVVDAKVAVTIAAREATRAYVEAPAGGAETAAQEAGRGALADTGRDPARLGLSVTLAEASPAAEAVRCRRVTTRATYHALAIGLPWGSGWGEGLEVSSAHSEIVDPYRSGLPGEAASSATRSHR